jgi:hypothetical protein
MKSMLKQMRMSVVRMSVLAAMVTAWTAGPARAADPVFLGGLSKVTSLHPTTNYLAAVMGSSTGAVVRLINESNLWASIMSLSTYTAAAQSDLTGASNVLRALFVANDTTTSNGVVTLLSASAITTSNGVLAVLVANDTTTSNGVVTLLRANDITTSNALYSALVANDTTTSNGVVTLVNARQGGSAALTNASVRLFWGTGTPESAVSAPQGSGYFCTNSCTGSGFYVKTNGTGSTGWWLVQDTGGVGGSSTQWIPNSSQFNTNASGDFAIKSGAPLTNTSIYPPSSSGVPLTVNAITGQDGNLFNAKDFDGTVLFGIGYDGTLYGRGANSPILQTGSAAGKIWMARDTTGIGDWKAPNFAASSIGDLTLTNAFQRLVHDAGNTTSLVWLIANTNAIVWSPSNNCVLALSGSWPAGIRQVIDVTLCLTNGQTNVALPYGGPNGETITLRTPPSTNALAIVSDGYRRWIETGVNRYNTNQLSSDGSSLKDGLPTTNQVLWASVTMPSLATNSIPYIGAGGIISTVALSGLTLSAGTLTSVGGYLIGNRMYTWPDNTISSAKIYDDLDNQFISSGNYNGAYLTSTSGGSAAWAQTATASSGRLGGRGGLVTLRTFNTNLSSYATVFWTTVSSVPNQGVLLVADNTAFTMTGGFDTNAVPLTNCPVLLGSMQRLDATAPASGIGWVYNPIVTNYWGCFSVNNNTASATNYVGPELMQTSNTLVTFGFKLTSSPTQIIFTTNGVSAFTNSTASQIPTNTILTCGARLGTVVTNISALTYGFEVDQVTLFEK